MEKIHNQRQVETTLEFLAILRLAFEEIELGSDINKVSKKYNLERDILVSIMTMATDILDVGYANLDFTSILPEKKIKFVIKFVRVLYPEHKQTVLVTIQMIRDVERIIKYFNFNKMELEVMTALTLDEVPSASIDRKYNKYMGYSKRTYAKYIRIIKLNIENGILPSLI